MNNNNLLSQLTPQERRIVVIVFLVVIVVLNLVFVWPHFDEWGSINTQLNKMRSDIESYNRLIAQDRNPTNGFQVQVAKLSSLEGGGSVMEHPVDPQIQLGNAIRAQERKTGVYVSSYSPGSIKTNEFFEELSTAITVESEEPQLVKFLYNMGLDPAMIRVAKLDLRPVDANRYKLRGGITLTANYTRKPPSAVNPASVGKPVAVGGTKPVPGAGPAPKKLPMPGTVQPGRPAVGNLPPGTRLPINQTPGGPPSPQRREPPGIRPGGNPALKKELGFPGKSMIPNPAPGRQNETPQ